MSSIRGLSLSPNPASSVPRSHTCVSKLAFSPRESYLPCVLTHAYNSLLLLVNNSFLQKIPPGLALPMIFCSTYLGMPHCGHL